MKSLSAVLLAASLASTAVAAEPKVSDSIAWSLPTIALSAAVVDASGVPMHLTPHGLLATNAALSVLGIYEEGDGFRWVLERPSDGARLSLRMAGHLAEGVSIAPGAVVSITVYGAGALLSAAGRALAFIPNASGRALFHHERVTD